MSDAKYNVITFLLAIFISPIIVTVGCIISGVMHVAILIFPSLFLISFWVLYGYKMKEIEKLSVIVAPLFWVFCYYMFLWIITFGLSKYQIDSLYFLIYVIFSLPYVIINFYVSFLNDSGIFPLIFTTVSFAGMISLLIGYKLGKKKIYFDIKAVKMGLILVCLCGLCVYQLYDYTKKIPPIKSQIDKVSVVMQLDDYQ